jgi:diadenylate cyclase
MSVFEQMRLLHPGWRDVLEVAIVSYTLYRVLLLFHRTRAIQVLGGVIVLALAYGAAYVLQLGMILYLLALIFSYGAIALLVVFAPELRGALAHVAAVRRHAGNRNRRAGCRSGRAAEPVRRRRDHRH